MNFGNPYNPLGVVITRSVRLLIIVILSVFLVQSVVDLRTDGFFSLVFGLSGAQLRQGYIWQPVSYIFLHSLGLWHILLNLLALYFFGSEMEETLGARRFLKLFFGAGVLAGLGWVAVNALLRRSGLCIGASGAVFGVMGAFAAMFPDRMITLLLFFVIPITLSARTLAVSLAILAVFGLILGDGNVAHAAHLVGGLVGFLYARRFADNPTLLDAARSPEPESPLSFPDHLRRFMNRASTRPTDDPDGILPTQENVDRILDKISREGIASLTPEERRLLEKASQSSRPR